MKLSHLLVAMSMLVAQFANASALSDKALELLERLPVSGYDNRVLCIVGNDVTAVVPMTHWAKNDRRVATGPVGFFPQEIKLGDAKIVTGIGDGGKVLVKHVGSYNDIWAVRGTVDGVKADICLVEEKPVLE
jgi:hypothetical protein